MVNQKMTIAKYTLLGLVAVGLVAGVAAIPPWAGGNDGQDWRGAMMHGQQMMHQGQVQLQEHMPDDAQQRVQEHRDEMQELMAQGVNETELQEHREEMEDFRDQNREEALERRSQMNESSNSTNNATRGPPTSFPGNGNHFGPPAFVADLVPDHVKNRVPGWLFG